MTANEILRVLVKDLKRSIKQFEDAMKKVTDTGLMWRATAYQEVLDRIEELRERE